MKDDLRSDQFIYKIRVDEFKYAPPLIDGLSSKKLKWQEFSSWSVQNSQNIHFPVDAAQEPNGTVTGFIDRNLDDQPSD